MGTRPAGSEDVFAPVRAVADAILYEGYLLYPYRRSSAKNRVRWQFGVLTPPEWTRARGPADTGVAGSAEGWWQRTECLLHGTAGSAVCEVRFLQLQRRTVERYDGGRYRPVEVLDLGDRREIGFDEAVPREFALRLPLRPGEDAVLPLEAGSGLDAEVVRDPDGRPAGRIMRERWPLSVTVRVSAEPVGRGPAGPLTRLRVQVENTGRGVPASASRDEALRFSPLACHLLLAVRGSSFVSLLDPPDWARAAVRSCENVHTFPVLAGGADGHELLLSSPILLYDHPRVAPESPGDLHDSGEIDEILSLRALTLTDAEKREARATDARAAAILDRVDGMPPEVFERLHGVLRPPDGTVPGDGDGDGDGDGGAGGPVETVVAGVRLGPGSRVRLRPRPRGTDPQDRFLAGRTALVEKVLVDVDDAVHLAVTVEDDPAAELDRWYGRYRYFGADEVEPLTGEPG
ncbi:hypothetical protein [Actinocorallia populi]|uniref:hypothetical protein n=1 Tax=Actinocorallia populi TaxID=2079200 RepID=UPI000D0891BC|nr:hypothetical protein [Actinocorallia populi]